MLNNLIESIELTTMSTKIWKKIKSTYYKAYNQIKSEKVDYPLDIHLKTFAGCVSMLCHDDISLPINTRSLYLLRLCQLSGGPTIREHYCMWQAFGRGDALRTMDNPLEITQFQLDPRLKRPGFWSYSEAYKFCLDNVFAPITKQHKFISQIENCDDDPPEDIEALNKITL